MKDIKILKMNSSDEYEPNKNISKFNLLMEGFMLDKKIKIQKMVKEYLCIQQEKSILADGAKIISMGKVSIFSQVEKFMMDSYPWVKNKELVLITMIMQQLITQVIGIKIKNKEKAF
jgi:hypothetical protein